MIFIEESLEFLLEQNLDVDAHYWSDRQEVFLLDRKPSPYLDYEENFMVEVVLLVVFPVKEDPDFLRYTDEVKVGVLAE